MERELKQKRQLDVDSLATSSSGYLRDRRRHPFPPATSPEDSPLSTMSSLSSLRHGFSPERVEVVAEAAGEGETSDGSTLNKFVGVKSQLEYLQQCLPGYEQFGISRKGSEDVSDQYCTIFYKEKVELLEGGTFSLLL
ncbi:hypothetical protein L1887_10951 [Cichorium endivia]|nr:hypothetical protein L1887_10951 [Cichorium endivia]